MPQVVSGDTTEPAWVSAIVKTSFFFQDWTGVDAGRAIIPGREADRWSCCCCCCCIRIVDFIVQIKSARRRNSIRRCRLYSMYRKASMFPSSSMQCRRFEGRRWCRRYVPNATSKASAVSIPGIGFSLASSIVRVLSVDYCCRASCTVTPTKNEKINRKDWMKVLRCDFRANSLAVIEMCLWFASCEKSNGVKIPDF